MPLADYLANYGTNTRDLPEISGSYAGRRAIVCGDAWCLWDDLEGFGCRSPRGRGCVGRDGYDFMTVNKVVETFPGNIEHAYSNEAHLLETFIKARRNEYRKEFSGPKHTHSNGRGAKWRWPWHGGGTSGLGAILTCLALGYDQVVLAGMPLDSGPHNGEPHWRKCSFEREAPSPKDSDGPGPHWRPAIEHAFQGKVKSLSGRTREWLGEP